MTAYLCDQCGRECPDGGRVFDGERWCRRCLDGIEIVTPGAGPVYVDHVPELLSWPGGQRASVSAVLGIFGRFVACVHRGHFEVAASVRELARNEMVMLLRNQRIQAGRARRAKKITPGLTAGQMRRS